MSFNIVKVKEELKKSEEWLMKEFSGVHTGRATPTILDAVAVEAYGSFQPVKNVASISVEDPRTLRVTPWDMSFVKEIEKAVGAANLGLSVSTDEKGLRVIFPMLTTENREKLVKVLKEKLEDARISVRKIREEILSHLKDEKLPEDTERKAKEDVQKVVDETNKNLEDLFKKKETELMTL